MERAIAISTNRDGWNALEAYARKRYAVPTPITIIVIEPGQGPDHSALRDLKRAPDGSAWAINNTEMVIKSFIDQFIMASVTAPDERSGEQRRLIAEVYAAIGDGLDIVEEPLGGDDDSGQ
jgi:hypothetical protein